LPHDSVQGGDMPPVGATPGLMSRTGSSATQIRSRIAFTGLSSRQM
jgi:hypothetical protein